MNTNTFFPKANHKTILTAGTVTETMIMGKRVPVRILKMISENPNFWMGAEYQVEYIGTENIILDFGQNWILKPGDKNVVHQGNIDRALELKAQGY